MSVFMFTWLLLLVSAFTSGFCDIFDDVRFGIGKTDQCVTACGKTYPLHTYPKVKDSTSCNRGCRFFSLNGFFDDSQDGNFTKQMCEETCVEAYEEVNERYACKTGCANMVPIAEKRRKELAAEPPSIHVVSPFMYMEDLFNNLFDKMNGAIGITWSYYVKNDNGKVIVMQSGPDVWSDELQFKDGKLGMGNVEPPRVLSMTIDEGAKLEDRSKTEDHQELKNIRNIARSGEADKADWLSCISVKFGLPKWLLAAILFSSILFIIWLCFVTSATAVPQPLHTQKLSLFGDIDYVDIPLIMEKEKVPLMDDASVVPVHQAPPLPIKLKMERV